MARKTRKRPAAVAGSRSKSAHFTSSRPLQPRDVLLAGLGAVSLGRKQLAGLVADGVDNAVALRSAAREAVGNASRDAGKKVVALRRQAEAQAAPVVRKVEGMARDASQQLRARLAPALAKIGVKLPAKRASKRAAPAKRGRKAAGKRRAA
jgi:hypothetical protein